MREPSEVSVGDAVHLSRNGKQLSLFLVDEEPVYRNVHSITDTR